jgi:hypothetical protein
MLFSHILPYTYQAQQQKSRAKDQNNFQREMSNTAYQRGMSDMKRAGLNPILASKLGGASSPSGAMAQVPDFGKAMSQAGPQAVQIALGKAQIQQATATAKNIMATTNKINEETKILKRTGGSIIGKTGLAIDRLLEDQTGSTVQDFFTGKALTNAMQGTDIEAKLKSGMERNSSNVKDALNAIKRFLNKQSKPLRLRINTQQYIKDKARIEKLLGNNK